MRTEDVKPNFDISLVVTSRNLSLTELSQILGKEPQSGSHCKGGARLTGEKWDCSVWRENARDTNADWRDQCLSLLREIPANWADLQSRYPDDISISLDMALFYDTAYASISMPPSLLREILHKNVGLEIAIYPVDETREE